MNMMESAGSAKRFDLGPGHFGGYNAQPATRCRGSHGGDIG